MEKVRKIHRVVFTLMTLVHLLGFPIWYFMFHEGSFWTFLWSLPLGLIVASLVHEIGHWLPAVLLGFKPKIRMTWKLSHPLICVFYAPRERWKEKLIALGGPLINLLCAFLLFFHEDWLIVFAHLGVHLFLWNMVPYKVSEDQWSDGGCLYEDTIQKKLTSEEVKRLYEKLFSHLNQAKNQQKPDWIGPAFF